MNDSRETSSVTLLRIAVYSAATLILATPLATGIGVLGGIAGAIGGVLAAERLAASRWRLWAVLAGAFGTILLGLSAEWLLGHFTLVARLIGASATAYGIDFVTLFALTLGLTTGLRTLSERVRALGVCELGLLVSAVALLFMMHRDMRLGQPQFLSDWTFSRGGDPAAILMKFGFLTLGISVLVLQRKQSTGRMLATVVVLFLLIGLGSWLFSYVPHSVFQPPPQQTAEAPPDDQGAPSRSDKGEGGAGREKPDESSSSGGSPKDNGPETPVKPDGNQPQDGQKPDSPPKPSGGQPDQKPADSGAKPKEPGESSSKPSGQQDQSPAKAESRDGSESTSKEPRDGQSQNDTQDPSESDQPPPKDQPWPGGGQNSSPRPVALVIVEEEYSPFERQWYFRQNAFSQFNGLRLVRSSSSQIDVDVPATFPSMKQVIPTDAGPKNLALTVPTTVHLIDEQSRPVCVTNPTEFEPIDNPNPDYFRQSYKVWSRVLVPPKARGAEGNLYAHLLDRKAGDPRWPASVRKHYLAGPDDPRYRELADKIIAESELPAEHAESPLLKALALGRWIAKNTTYTTKVRDRESQDPAAPFLFDDRRGYCVHVAHAMVYMLRSQGVPARAGVGYSVPADRQGKSSTIVIQSSDGHAWPEIYLEGIGWLVVDTSPETIDQDEQQPSQPDKATQNFLRRMAEPQDSPLPQPESESAFGLPDWRWLLLGAIVGLYVVKMWRRWIPWFAAPGKLYRVCYRAVLDRLAERGLVREFGETREEFAQRVAAVVPEFSQLTAAHVRQAVGGDTRSARDEWIGLMKRVNERVAHVGSVPRRVWAWLNPAAWIWVR